MQRIIIIALAVLFFLSVVSKSRVSGTKPAPAAFSVISSGVRLIRVSGDVRYPGIYPVGANIMAGTAIKMAVPVHSLKRLVPSDKIASPVIHGEQLHLALQKDGTGTLTVGSMSSKERMIMGVPLDINSMSAADFDLLPGIGPTVAQRIIEYRHKNGGTMTVEELQAVEGIGDKKYKAIIMYF